MNAVEWRPVRGFPGYEVSSDGRVKSLKGSTPLILKPFDRNGYPTVTIKDIDGVRKSPCVHRLVLLSFIGEPEPHQRVCRHLDGNRKNNRVENLRWGTHAENSADALSHGTLSQWWGAQSTCRRGHEYTPENTRINREGHRECRACCLERAWAKKGPDAKPRRRRFNYATTPAVDTTRDAKATNHTEENAT